MNNLEKKSGGEAKIQEYLDRIKMGESKDELLRDLPEIFRSAIEKGLNDSELEKKEKVIEVYNVPPQYEGLPSFVLEEIWIIPVYVDSEKTKSENERKFKVLEKLKKEELEKAELEEKQLNDQERIEEIKKEMRGGKDVAQNAIKTVYNDFLIANGETDTGVFWYQYRNKKAKELKESGQLEWGKERIYFDIKMEDMERLRDLAIRVSGEKEIAIDFKYLDEEKTFPIQKDGKETRFVVNFASEDDAKKFLLAMKSTDEYASFISDRNMSHNGIRIDGIAEYASEFREGRSALERVMQGEFNEDKSRYTYKAESGREITIGAEEYEVFKNQYEKFSNEMREKEEQWRKIFNLNSSF